MTPAMKERLDELEAMFGRPPSFAVRRILERAEDCLRLDRVTGDDGDDARLDLQAMKTATDLELKAFELARKEAQTGTPHKPPALTGLSRKQ